MIKAAVLGSPISHSLSPALHKRAYELLGVAASYGAIELHPESAGDFLLGALQEDWTGFSLTMPLKEKIFGLMDLMDFRIDSEATRMRSANTLVVENGGFRATSTDRTGFIRLFDGLARKRVAIIGGGGTARAALAALEGAATTVDFLLRSSARTEILAKVAISTEVNFFGMDHSLRGYDLVIATVPSGVSDLIAATLDFPIPAFCEVLYNPFPTALLAKARSLGSRTMDGIDLLVEQALDQVKLFSKQNFEFEAMRGELQAIGRAHLH
jgi:shikimate dehydrogenase